MATQCIPSPASFHAKIHRYATISPSWATINNQDKSVCFKFRITYYACACKWKQELKSWSTRKPYAMKAKKGLAQLDEQPIKVAKKKGTIAGAVALIIGTSIGSGILVLPKKAASAGVLPSSISMIICWAFLLIEAILLIEINVGLHRNNRKKEENDELEVISIRTMAQETLGEWGGTLATITYVFLGYTSMIAYSSKSGDILFHLLNLPQSVSGFLFTAMFTMLISIGGTRTTDKVNQWLTASVIGLLLAIEVLAVVLGGWSGLEGSSDWGKVPTTIPVIIFSLAYHDLAPVLCAYLGRDLPRLRTSVLLGSLVPLLALLVWNAIALGLSPHSDQLDDPVELLMRVPWSGVSLMVEAFSLLAIGTSLIGTLLGFSEFFKEQLENISWHSSSIQILRESNKLPKLRSWWGSNKISFTAMAMVVSPTIFVSTVVPDAFSAATDIAGGYCMTVLYGVLPPAMAWAMHNRECEGTDQKALSRARPALFGVGLFACGIVADQILQDFLAFQPN
ncbi:Trp_Tyr_perm domain-containing protein [Cephalotus follicularis]|uniref:Trp_Tyr_perm domain-containing protein n=1 Tax=Cephalotus follicularis TaxID=3775 RepID=A0A1Q3BPP2_CEPFO|nr:Trp_Tyr_perm domain-containing protein [Cephalotus follicularis]